MANLWDFHYSDFGSVSINILTFWLSGTLALIPMLELAQAVTNPNTKTAITIFFILLPMIIKEIVSCVKFIYKIMLNAV